MAKLVAIGDNLMQGFRSLAIHKTNLSSPALIAESLGISVPDLRVPKFFGEAASWIIMKGCGRLPARRRYFDYDAHFYTQDKKFDPGALMSKTLEKWFHISWLSK